MRGREQMDVQFAPQDVSTVRLEFTSLTPTLISRAAPSARLISTSPRMIGQAPFPPPFGVRGATMPRCHVVVHVMSTFLSANAAQRIPARNAERGGVRAHTVISNFLDQTECDFLKALSGPELRRSRVTNGRVIENRTSYSTFLTGEKVCETASLPHRP